MVQELGGQDDKISIPGNRQTSEVYEVDDAAHLVETAVYLQSERGGDTTGLSLVAAMRNPHNPQVKQALWQSIWNNRAEKLEQKVQVPPVPLSEETIKRYEQRGNSLFYMPPEIDLPALMQLFAQEIRSEIDLGKLKNVVSRPGWRFGTATSHPQFKGTRAQELRKAIEASGWEPMDLSEYTVLLDYMSNWGGRYKNGARMLDSDGTESRLLGTVYGNVEGVFADNVTARTQRRRLYLDRFPTSSQVHNVGGRSSISAVKALTLEQQRPFPYKILQWLKDLG